MARSRVTLTGWTLTPGFLIQWNGDERIGTGFATDGSERRLTRLQLPVNNPIVPWIRFTFSGELAPAVEEGTFTLSVPGQPTVEPVTISMLPDRTNPYQWRAPADGPINLFGVALSGLAANDRIVQLDIYDGVDDGDLALPEPADVTALVGTTYAETLGAATGGIEPYEYELVESGTTALPSRFTFDDSDLELTTVALAANLGDIDLVYRVTDAAGVVEMRTFTFTIAYAPLVIPLIEPIRTTEGVMFSQQFGEATGGLAPYTYTLTPLPTGMMFNDNTRTFGGTPTEASIGVSTLQYVVTDSQPTPAMFTLPISFTVTKDLRPGFLVEIDWDDDGQFDNALSDVGADVLSIGACKRGKDFGAHIYGRSVAGVFQCQLLDDSRVYDRFSATSPLSGKVIPGRRIRSELLAAGAQYQTVWNGLVDTIEPRQLRQGRRVSIRALGALAWLAQQTISVPMATNVLTSAAVTTIFNAANLPAEYRGTIAGIRRMPRWWVRNQSALAALRDLEATELGAIWEDANGRINFDSEVTRRTADRTVQATFTTGAPAAGEYVVLELSVTDPLKDIATQVTVPVRRYEVENAAEVLWTWGGNPERIATGATWAITATLGGRAGIGVDNWATMTAGTDYVVAANSDGTGNRNGQVDVSVTDTTANRRITIENTGSSDVWLISLQARGHIVSEANPYEIISEDTDATAAYGSRPYLAPSTFLSAVDAATYGDYLLSLFSEPHSQITIRYDDDDNGYIPEINHVVALKDGGDPTLYFVEQITHRWGKGGRHSVKLVLTDTSIESQDLFTLGDATRGALGQSDYLIGR